MFCGKCGTQIEAGNKFCGSCGEAVEEVKKTELKIPSIKKLKKFLIPFVALLLVVVLGLITYTTAVFGLFPAMHAKGPVALALKSIYSMRDLSSAEFQLNMSDGSNISSASGYFILGKDFKNSSMELRFNQDGDTVRAAYSQGNFGSFADNVYLYMSEIEQAKGLLTTGEFYLPADYDEHFQMLRDAINETDNSDERQHYERQLEMLQSCAVTANDLIKDKSFNIKLIQDTVQRLAEYETDNEFAISEKAEKEAQKLLNNFVFKECEKEEVYEKFIFGLYTEKSGKTTINSFNFQLSSFLITALDYVRTNLNSFPELKSALDDYAKAADSDYFLTGKEMVDYLISQIRDNADDIPTITVAITLDNKSVLQSFDLEWYDDYHSSYAYIKLEVSNHNKVKANSESIDAFLTKAKEEAENEKYQENDTTEDEDYDYYW